MRRLIKGKAIVGLLGSVSILLSSIGLSANIFIKNSERQESLKYHNVSDATVVDYKGRVFQRDMWYFNGKELYFNTCRVTLRRWEDGERIELNCYDSQSYQEIVNDGSKFVNKLITSLEENHNRGYYSFKGMFYKGESKVYLTSYPKLIPVRSPWRILLVTSPLFITISLTAFLILYLKKRVKALN